MTVWGWVVLAVSVAALVWMGLALGGTVRALAALRERVAALEAAASPVHLAEGLPVGAREPSWEIGEEGGRLTSTQFAGTRHLVLFADAGCRACDRLVPEVAGAAGSLPPVILVGNEDTGIPPTWTAASSVRAGAEQGHDVSGAFRTEVSPHAFVVDESGFVAAQGMVSTLEEVRALLHEADQMQIVTGSSDG